MPEKIEKQKKKRKKHPIIKFLFKMLFLGVAGYLLFTYVLGVYRMSGPNMFPSIKDGDLCILYRLEDYHNDEIVLYKTGSGTMKLGRIIAAPGQTVDFMEEGGFTVNGYQPTEKIPYQTFAAEESKAVFPVTLAEDEVFIMNDFRSDTSDGREFGAVKKSDISGKLIFILRRREF